jgi:hypothetical protein
VEGDEECDDDTPCCTASCTFAGAGTSCSDAQFCNGAETCDGSGVCQAGTDPCDSGTTCDEATDTCEAAIDGATLFVTTCGGCHTGNGLGTGSISDVTGATAESITNAIAGVGAMGSIDLTSEEIQAIADAL